MSAVVRVCFVSLLAVPIAFLGGASAVSDPAGPAPGATATPGQQSRCADCHFANWDAPSREHLLEWAASPHGRGNVGCEACHGGDPTTFEEFRAHEDILGSGNPASPVNRRNLPATCGACHRGPYVAFQRSRHLEVLSQGDTRAPDCTTCHGTVGAHVLSPRGLEGQCARCHAGGDTDEDAGYPGTARRVLQIVAELRVQLDRIEERIGQLQEGPGKDDLENALQQARVPLQEATDAIHAFRFEGSGERLDVTQRRVEQLWRRLDEVSGDAGRTGSHRPAY